ncbi:hypothetical protein RJ55_03432 [Drechmeria coniospora]|nr:hypothetical protein RJ55_03432 [Drechmeria coniospora]
MRVAGALLFAAVASAGLFYGPNPSKELLLGIVRPTQDLLSDVNAYDLRDVSINDIFHTFITDVRVGIRNVIHSTLDGPEHAAVLFRFAGDLETIGTSMHRVLRHQKELIRADHGCFATERSLRITQDAFLTLGRFLVDAVPDHRRDETVLLDRQMLDILGRTVQEFMQGSCDDDGPRPSPEAPRTHNDEHGPYASSKGRVSYETSWEP